MYALTDHQIPSAECSAKVVIQAPSVDPGKKFPINHIRLTSIPDSLSKSSTIPHLPTPSPHLPIILSSLPLAPPTPLLTLALSPGSGFNSSFGSTLPSAPFFGVPYMLVFVFVLVLVVCELGLTFSRSSSWRARRSSYAATSSGVRVMEVGGRRSIVVWSVVGVGCGCGLGGGEWGGMGGKRKGGEGKVKAVSLLRNASGEWFWGVKRGVRREKSCGRWSAEGFRGIESGCGPETVRIARYWHF